MTICDWCGENCLCDTGLTPNWNKLIENGFFEELSESAKRWDKFMNIESSQEA